VEYQTFRGSDVKEALSAVKAALGPDAMIGSTRFVSGDRTSGLNQAYVEVLAAQPSGARGVGPFARGASGYQAVRKETNGRASAQGRARRAAAKLSLGISALENQVGERLGERDPAPKPRTDLANLENELMSLKAMLEDLHAARPPKEQALGLLAGLGIEGSLARDLASGAGRSKKRDPEELREWLKAQVAKRVLVSPGLINGSGKQVVACVGPTGVGKTTTLAKLAAIARLDLGKSVGVISLDTFRVGAAEQWHRYADLMGLSAHVAHNPDAFRNALQQNSSDLLLIDTPGHVGKTGADWPIAQCLGSVTGRKLDTLLVLPSWLRALDVEQVTRDYDAARPTGLVATKLDEASRTGGVLHGSAIRELPFTYLCNGPRVPEDIFDATHDTLLSAVFDR
jgi:flagellar biosynthesis protein FlhF